MKLLLNFSVVLALLSIFSLTACKKTNIPPTPEDGGKIRLSKVFRNDNLFREYEYSDTGRLLRTRFTPSVSVAETVEFTYDNQGRIIAARKELPYSGTYILSDVVYKSDGDLERQNEKVYRSSNNQLLGEYQTDITYAPIEEVGKRITVVTRLLPSGSVTNKEIYSYYTSNNYPKIKGSLQSFLKLNSGDSTFYQYFYRTDNDQSYTSPVKALNPYQYVNTYGYELVRPSMHVPSNLWDYYYRNGARLTEGETNYFYDKVINNLIEESRDDIHFPGQGEVIRWKYEYIVLKK